MKQDGFTLIEVLIVAVITVLLTTALITNFSRTRSELQRTAAGIISDVRVAQNRAVSGTLLDGFHRCGYGIVFLKDPDRYLVYAGPEARNCSTDDHEWSGQGSEDSVVFEIPLFRGLEFGTVGDVYFEPPLPKTYINAGSLNSIEIQVREPNARDCPSAGCRTITINAAGQVR